MGQSYALVIAEKWSSNIFSFIGTSVRFSNHTSVAAKYYLMDQTPKVSIYQITDKVVNILTIRFRSVFHDWLGFRMILKDIYVCEYR